MSRRPSLLLQIAVASLLSGCGGSSAKTTATRAVTRPEARTRTRTATAHAFPAVRSLTAQAAGHLAAGVQWPATAVVGGDVLLMGGLDQATASVADIVAARPAGTVERIGALPYAVHDAAGASLGGTAYLFGGGEPSYSDILRVDPHGDATVAGHLPAAASDVAAGVIGTTVYVVGGYTGTAPLDTIVAWSGSGTARVVARLPHPIRYAAVAALGGRLIVAGGTSGVDATRAVYAFDPARGSVHQIGLLPHPLTHGVAAALGDRVYVIGGRGAYEGTQTKAILAIDPVSGRVRSAGRLPVALSDVGAATIDGAVMVAGGRETSGTLSQEVYLLRPLRGTA